MGTEMEWGAKVADTQGNKSTAAAESPSTTDSMMAYIKGILVNLNRGECPAMFWSEIQANLQITNVAADLALPDVVVPAAASGGIPSGAYVKSIRAAWCWRKSIDSSLATNNLVGANKGIRSKVSTAAWAASMMAINMPTATLRNEAGVSEGGDIVIGTINIMSLFSPTLYLAGFTANFASRQTALADAIVAVGANLDLYDVRTCLIVRYV